MTENALKTKSFEFALRVVKLYQLPGTETKEYVLSKQILRSGTSIGANVEEATHAQSRSDFISKLSIAQKEASETNYWIRLLCQGGFVKIPLANSLLEDCEELQRLLAASIKTAKNNNQKQRART